ncbi:MAG: CotH kinase family protein, partial [Phycisphaerae bacterium]|nr:CotH kinase family protein [Phycisphaerae bacterium]
MAAGLALAAWPLYGQEILITEVMAVNGRTLADESGEYGDWVELYNPTGLPIDVGGLFLTDDPEDPTLWQIPTGRPSDTVIGPGRFLLIWADQGPPTPGLHAGFKLEAGGESVSLFDRDGARLIDSVVFPRQRTDISYGRDPHDTGQWRYLMAPTPGGPNLAAFTGEVADLRVSHGRGFYDAPFLLEISTDTAGATIVYTVDGGVPCDAFGVRSAGARVYTGPISVSTTTCVRAAGCRSGWLSTPVQTHTYIFPEAVRHQATDPTTGAQVVPVGHPSTWPGGSSSGAVTGDYQVDPDVVGDNDKFGGLYRLTFKDDLKAVPTISVVMALDDWFGPTGIYINQSQDGTERACSLEWIDPNGAGGFQIDCAMAMQGGVGGGGTSLDRWKVNKLSMRPRFKTTLDNGQPTGGPSGLDYRVFPDSPVTRYDTFVLDALLANTWNHKAASQNTHPNYLQDQFTADLHNAMGGHSPHGLFAHLYINGLYWGMYNVHDRPDHAWAAQMFGGEKDEYDCLRHNAGNVVHNGPGGSGSATTRFNAMISAANAVASDPTNAARYDALCRMLDVDNFITEILAHWYALNWDWPDKNWYATHRNTPEGRWRFHCWDAEHALEYWDSRNIRGLSEGGIHDKLKTNAEYRMRFADLAHRFFFNGGVLSYPAVADLYRARVAEIDRAIVGESARWGDTRLATPGTRADWAVVEANVIDLFLQPRPDFILNWLKTGGLYPAVGAPVFQVNGSYRHGGQVASTDTFSITVPPGTTGKIYYTLDGTDPRVPAEGSQQPPPTVTLVPEDAAKKVLVPTQDIGTTWRGGNEPFNDSTWTHGTPTTSVKVGGVGFETGTGYEAYITYDVRSVMYGKNGSCSIRIPFMVTTEHLAATKAVTLRARCDDGFVAFLNGVEVGSINRPATLAWNSTCANRSDSPDLVEVPLTNAVPALRMGSNILAIHAMNQSTTSTDFLFSAEMVASSAAAPGSDAQVSPSALLYTGPVQLLSSARVKARVLSSGEWSALNEAVYAVGPVAESLRVTEIMYHPLDTGDPGDANAEYIELANVGSEAVNLNLVRFTEGIGFTFGDMSLQPGRCVLVVKDLGVFTARYGEGLP